MTTEQDTEDTSGRARDWSTLIGGIVGSHAYGLATPSSDVDRLSVAAAPTARLHGLHPPRDRTATAVRRDPDAVVHEAGKYVSLCLKANPTVTELLWLPQECYEYVHPLGKDLIAIRSALLSARAVRNAYFGYATEQFRRLKRRDDGTFSSDVRGRTEKHARHIMRLVTAGTQLYLTGELMVRVPDPERYHEFGRLVASDAERGLEAAERLIVMNAAAIDSKPSALPEQPDEAAAEKWLHSVRTHFWR